MKHRIKSVKPLGDCIILIVFFDGTIKEYDVKKFFSIFPQFKAFDTDKGLFGRVRVDPGGYGISWNDSLDLDADDLWEGGLETGKEQINDIHLLLAWKLVEARDIAHMTQKQLSEKTRICQADINKIEKGFGDPSLDTLVRLADGMEMVLNLEFIPKKDAKS